MKVLSLICCLIFMSSCMVTEYGEKSCSDQIYNGSWKHNKKILPDLYICDNSMRLNDSDYQVSISRNNNNNFYIKLLGIDDISPFRILRNPYSNSIMVDEDTLYMIHSSNKKEWTKYVK